MRNTAIEWAHHTFNPWEGCEKVSDACKNCYAETHAERWGHKLGGKRLPLWGPGSRRKFRSDAYWKQPLKWNRAAVAAGERHRVFCMSLGDFFETLPAGHPDWEKMAHARYRTSKLIEATPQLDWLLLTKRPENIMRFWDRKTKPEYDNVWLGTTVENQSTADERLPHLLRVAATVHFISCEPLLGAVDIEAWLLTPQPVTHPNLDIPDGERLGSIERSGDRLDYWGHGRIDWVIAGGESGTGARPTHPAWFRQLRDHCARSDTPFLFKQWGAWAPREHCDDRVLARAKNRRIMNRLGSMSGPEMVHVGKKKAGRLLDSVEHNEVPTP